MLERFHHSLKSAAIRVSQSEHVTPAKAILNTLVTYRSTVQPITGLAPAVLMLGRQLRVPANSFSDLVCPHRNVSFEPDAVRDHVEQVQHKMAAAYDKSHRASKRRFDVGDWVRVRVQVRNRKSDPIYSEPHQIIRRVSPFTVMLDNGKRWHFSKLRFCEPPDNASDAGLMMNSSRNWLETSNLLTRSTGLVSGNRVLGLILMVTLGQHHWLIKSPHQ
jgi:hypothetical protein